MKKVYAPQLDVKDSDFPAIDLAILDTLNGLVLKHNLHHEHPIDLSHVDMEVKNRELYITGVAKADDYKKLLGIVKSVDAIKEVHQGVKVS